MNFPTRPDAHEKDRHIDPIVDFEEPVEIEELGEHKLEEQDDGSVLISLDEPEIPEPIEFQANLAEHFEERDLTNLATSLIEQIDRDREARKRRDEQYEEGLRRTGLGNDAPGGAGFEGASKVVHPMLAEACVDFAARAIKELFPPAGPVKTAIEGIEDERKVDVATRKAKFLNWQLRKKIPEWRTEQEQLFTQLPMGGSQYQKFWHDDVMRRIRTEFVPIDDILLPYAATNFYAAQRVTHVQHLVKMEFDQRVDSGLYREIIDIAIPPLSGDKSASAEANDKIEGRSEDPYNEDGLRDVYEVYTWQKFEGDDVTAGSTAPYIITIDKYTEKVLSIYRNWEEGDETLEKLDWFVEWKFIPWRGAYAIGFPHLIGGLSAAATGALRALLDAAHINNSSTLVKLRGGKTSGQNITVEPTEIAEIDGPAGSDDIRKVIMPMPYNQPSPVLFQLLGWITQAGKGVIATAEEKLEQVGDRTPVGTTQALIEQGSLTYSSIHARLHGSQEKALQIVCRLNRMFLDDQTTVKELGGLVMSREEFGTTDDISPVSDPEIFSEAQRFAQNQGIIQLRQIFNGQTLPSLPFNDISIARRMLRRMRIENIDELLPEPPKPQNLNPAAENVAAIHGAPLTALPKQNHIAHIFSHIEFCLNPIFANPVMGAKLMGGMVAHLTQHIGFYYADLMAIATRFDESAGQIPTKQMEDRIARANTAVLHKMQKDLMPVAEKLMQIQELAKKFSPPPMVDPAVDATYKAAIAEVERKAARDKAELDVLRQEKLQVNPGIEKEKLRLDMAKNVLDNRQKHVTEVRKNVGDNRTKQWIAAMQAQQADGQMAFQAKLDHDEANLAREHEATMQSLQPTEGGGISATPEPVEPAVDDKKLDTALYAVNMLTAVSMAPKEIVRDAQKRAVAVRPAVKNMKPQGAPVQGSPDEKLDMLIEAITQLTKTLAAPKAIVRDTAGKAVGVQPVTGGDNASV